jgi:hypothetical protein
MVELQLAPGALYTGSLEDYHPCVPALASSLAPPTAGMAGFGPAPPPPPGEEEGPFHPTPLHKGDTELPNVDFLVPCLTSDQRPRVLVASQDSRILQVWDVQKGTRDHWISGDWGDTRCLVAFELPNGQPRFVAGDQWGRLTSWHGDTAEECWEVGKGT